MAFSQPGASCPPPVCLCPPAAAEGALGQLFGPEMTRATALRLLGTPLVGNPHHVAVPVSAAVGPVPLASAAGAMGVAPAVLSVWGTPIYCALGMALNYLELANR